MDKQTRQHRGKKLVGVPGGPTEQAYVGGGLYEYTRVSETCARGGGGGGGGALVFINKLVV